MARLAAGVTRTADGVANMISAAEYRAKATAALTQADLATTPRMRELYVITAREWRALSVTAAAHEKRERDLL